MSRDAKAGLVPAGGNQSLPVLEGAAPLTAACPSLEGRSGDGWMSMARNEAKVTVQSHDRDVTPAPHSQTATCATRISLTGDADPRARSDLPDAGVAPPRRTPGDHR